MAGILRRLFGPLALTTTTTTNIYQGAAASALLYDQVRLIHVVNKTAGAVPFSLWLGATGANTAGTEVAIGKSVPPNDYIQLWLDLRLNSTDFLVGGAGALTSLSIIGMGYQNAVGG